MSASLIRWADVRKLLPGASLPGGIFTGIVYVRKKPCILVTGPESDALTWDQAQAWAKALHIQGLSDFTVSARLHQAMQHAYLKKFFRNESYWSCKQHALDSDSAWLQSFDNGYQYYWGKYGKRRARAVRLIDVQ